MKYLDYNKMGKGHHGWLNSTHHFSFASYYNPNNIHFGQLRVINDDEVDVGEGFSTHPHQDMEIVSYVLNGVLEHKDSMKNERHVTRGGIQYMSAGTGVTHSEYNGGKDLLHFLQIWIFPRTKGLKPNYGDYVPAFEERYDTWLHLISDFDDTNTQTPVKIHQDANLFARYATEDSEFVFEVKADRQAYLVLAEGEAEINGQKFNARDGAEFKEENINIKAKKGAHFVVIELKKY